MSYLKKSLVFVSFLVHLNPAAIYACPPSSQCTSPAQVKVELVELRSLNEITIQEIDLLISELGSSASIARQKIGHVIQSIDDKVKTLSQSPMLVQCNTLTKTVAKHHFKSRTLYRLPRFVGFDCKECGFGTLESWAYRVARSVCPGDECCWFVWGSFLCAGVQNYAYQWILSPLTGWDCTEVDCKTELPSGDVRRWAVSLKQGLTQLNARFEDLIENAGSGEIPDGPRFDAPEALPSAPDDVSFAGNDDPRTGISK